MTIGYLKDLAKFIPADCAASVHTFIENVKLQKAGVGEWIILQPEMKALLLESSAYNAGVFESNKIFRDIHIVLRGTDTLYLGSMEYELKNEYVETGDYTLFNSEIAASVKLNENMFAIIEQGLLHSNHLEPGSQKIVIKIK